MSSEFTTMANLSERIEKLMDEYAENVARSKNAHLELLAQAFLQETGLKPSEIELVQESVGTTIRWYYRKRGTT